MRFTFLSILLCFLLPFTSAAPTPTLPRDIARAGNLSPHVVQARQAPAAPSGATSPPAAAPSTSSSDTSMVTTIVQAVWPDVDPLIQQGVIYFASGIPSMLSSLMSSLGY